QPRMTGPQPTIASQNISQPTPWGAPPQYAAAPKKSSKAWLWVVGILALVVSMDNSTANNSAKPSPSNSRTVANTSSSPGNDEKANVESVDLSQWVKEFS